MYSWTFQTPNFNEVTPYYYSLPISSQQVNFPFYTQFEVPTFYQPQTPKQLEALPKLPTNSSIQTPLTEKKKLKKQNDQIPTQVKEFPTSCKNIKANILKDFVRYIKRDSSQILLAIYRINSEYPIKKFIDQLLKRLPSDGKYIKFKEMEEVCRDKQNREFSFILRIIFKKFLKNDYLLTVLSKKKNKFWYIKACRQLQSKLFYENQALSNGN